MQKITKTNEEWKKELDPDTYAVTREQGTEIPFSGKYVHETAKGTYTCSNCGLELFSSDSKHDSTKGPAGLQGWPSFDQALEGSIEYREDSSAGMHRTEVVCARCEAHLGHLFDDPSITTTGKHLCINSCSLNLRPEGIIT
jgi:peptide-methionine (R)-S-oxide reductase